MKFINYSIRVNKFYTLFPEISKDANDITMWFTIKDKNCKPLHSFRIKQKALCTIKHAFVCVHFLKGFWMGCCSSVRCSAVMSNQSERFPHNLFSEHYSRSSDREFSKIFSNETGSERDVEMEDRKERMNTHFFGPGAGEKWLPWQHATHDPVECTHIWLSLQCHGFYTLPTHTLP